MIQKLETVGVKGVALSWFDSYLRDRRQCVEILERKGETLSTYITKNKTISFGVPQGSNLGPILFLLYVNNIPRIMKNCSVIMYADDITLAYTHSSLACSQSLQSKISSDLKKLSDYLSYLNLRMNVSKTNVIQFTTRSCNSEMMEIVLNGDQVSNVDITKFLGLHLDKNVSWKEQVKKIKKKLGSSLFLIRRLSKFVSIDTLKVVYYAFCYAHLSYGVHLWGYATKEAMNTVFIKQKRIIRSIVGAKYDDPCRPLFRSLQFLTFPSIYIQGAVMFYVNNKKKLPTVNTQHGYETRNRYEPVLERRRLVLQEQDPILRGYQLFKKLPSEIQSKVNCKTMFARDLKKYLVEKLFYSVEEFES
jgi:hypothetical protein